MKKFLLIVAAIAATFSAFAEDFSIAKYKQLTKEKDRKLLFEYCYSATPTAESMKNSYQVQMAFQYYIRHVNKKPTKAQVDEFVSKYTTNKKFIYRAYAYAGFIDEALQGCKDNKIDEHLIKMIRYEKAEAWKVATKVLLLKGGITNTSKATKLIEDAFRYKPATVTKEQQIKFIEQLAQIYPIPGSDFGAWKGFMGFIGYKYKALTGKDLFPESK